MREATWMVVMGCEPKEKEAWTMDGRRRRKVMKGKRSHAKIISWIYLIINVNYPLDLFHHLLSIIPYCIHNRQGGSKSGCRITLILDERARERRGLQWHFTYYSRSGFSSHLDSSKDAWMGRLERKTTTYVTRNDKLRSVFNHHEEQKKICMTKNTFNIWRRW